MLNKKNRIGNPKVIEKLFDKGKLYKNHFLIFKYEKSPSDTPQFAVVVSKKIYRKAVKRNRLRRQIYEILRLNLELLKENVKALVIARPSSQKASFQELSKSIAKFLKTTQSNEK